MEEQLREMVAYLVKQQFARSGDYITDRMKYQNIRIQGSGAAINQFIEILTDKLSLLIEGFYDTYLEEICSSCNIDKAEITKAFSTRVSILESEDRTPPLILTSLLGEFLGRIREGAFQETLQEVKNRVKKRLKITKNPSKEFDKEFDDKIGNLFQGNEPNISILYNICFLMFIADLVEAPRVKRTSKIQLGKYMNRLVEKLSKN